ncbi:hypothetical protein [Pollutibacter soli]|uniref:hypothetical protein n=1 Tax=Pollutibacter soli TaxID=3034157 RepID=UPI003014170D
MKKNNSRTTSTESESGEVKRGYNERNPGEPQGAFKPDAAKTTPKAPKKSPSATKK